MKAIHFFYTGLAIDGLVLAFYVSNFFMEKCLVRDITNSTVDGFSDKGKLLLWLFLLLLVAVIGAAFCLKNAGKLRLANILLWLPALPMAHRDINLWWVCGFVHYW